MQSTLTEFLLFITPVIAAAASSSGFDLFAQITKLTATWPGWTKQLIVATLAFVVFKVGAVIGLTIVPDASGETLKSLDTGEWVTAGLAFIFKLGGQVKSATVAARRTTDGELTP